MNFWPTLVFDAENVEIATLFFDGIFFQTQGTQKFKKIMVPIDPEGVHMELWTSSGPPVSMKSD